ncbi:hypothetical protein G6F21_013800 [Rhizopus arrhizus]|nr:hypothetical protein G6F21_013800 [Rhizopus arrhizus]
MLILIGVKARSVTPFPADNAAAVAADSSNVTWLARTLFTEYLLPFEFAAVILTVAVVTKPFPFEGRRRMQVALKGIEELSQHCDSLITIPNEKLITVLGRNATMIQAFRAANDVLQGAVQGIADLIVRPGLINVDFADVRTVMPPPNRRSRTRCWTT